MENGIQLPTGVVTLLLTDVVGSTAAWDRAPEAMAVALKRHDELVADRVARCGGHLVKSKGEGDSTFNVFERASDAVRAAVEVQQTLLGEPWPEGIDLRVRAAVHTGETLARDGDYYGGTVNRAARLRSIARAAEILTSETTATLVAGALPEGMGLTDRGVHTLRDLARPERVFAVSGGGLPDLGPPETVTSGDHLRVPLPRRLAARTPFGYVGREADQERVSARLDATIAGDGPSLVVVSGEAGIGKTQLVCEIAAAAVEAGVAVLYARCAEDGGPAYAPLAHLVEGLVDAMPATVVERTTDPHRAVLGRVLPTLRSRWPSSDGEADRADPVAERFQLFHGVAEVVAAASSLTPLLLVIDDLHWADGPTLALLRHLVTSTTEARVLFVATCRDTPGDTSPELADALAAFAREPNIERVALAPLTAAELEELVRRAAGDELAAAATSLAAGLFQETGGHPYFTVELLRHLVDRGHLSEDGGMWRLGDDVDEVALPRSVRDVVAQRVEGLGADAAGVLRAASVIGQSFDLAVLAAVVDHSEDEVLNALELAVDAALVRETVAERFTFAHGLVRSSLSAGLSPTRRAGVHRRVAQAIEQRGHDDEIGELAGHWEAAGRPDDLERALAAARSAGERALVRLGPADAVAWFTRAADLAERTNAGERVRCDLNVRLGDAQRQAGMAAYRVTLLDAARQAAAIGADDLVVEAALANDRGFQSASTQVDRDRVAVLELALERVPPADDRTRARVLAMLANELSYSRSDRDRRARLAEEAVDLARATGDPRALLAAVHRSLLPMLSPANLPLRLRWCDEAEAALAQIDDPVLGFLIEVSVGSAYVDAFAVREAARCRASFVERADRLGQPLLRWTSRWSAVQIATLQGRLDDAEATMEEGLQLGTQSGEADALQIYAANLVGLRFAQGRLGELRDLLGAVAADMPNVVGFRILLALAHADDGALDDAARLYLPLAAADFAGIPEDPGWPSMMGACAEICVRLPGEPGAARLYELLAPWREQTAAVTAMCLGSFGRQAAELALALGRLDDAAGHLAWVAAHAEQEGAAVELTRTWLAQARLAQARGAAAGAIVQLAEQAAASAEQLGASGVVRGAADLIEAIGG